MSGCWDAFEVSRLFLQAGSTFRGASTPLPLPSHKFEKTYYISWRYNTKLKYIPLVVLLASDLVLRHLKFLASIFPLRDTIFSQNLFLFGTTLWAIICRWLQVLFFRSGFFSYEYSRFTGLQGKRRRFL